MLAAIFAGMLAVSPAVPIPVPDADEHVLLADDWARPRSGARVSSLPAVRAAVAAWRGSAGGVLVVVHPGGEAGMLWGAEVRDWLVALGVPSDRVRLAPGSARADAVILRTEPR
jgi:hypothetical protein